MQKYDYVQLTQTTYSGTADGTGTWETITPADDMGVLPAGTTTLLILAKQIESSARWCGLRSTGKTNPVSLFDFTRKDIPFFVPLGTNDQIDLYAENSNVKFYVVASFTDDELVMFDVDGTLPTTPDTGSTYSLTTISGVPSTASGVVVNDNGGTFGSGDPLTSTSGSSSAYGSQIVLQDSSTGNVYIWTYDPFPVHGYFKEGVVINDFQNAFTLSANSTWETVSVANPGKDFVIMEAIPASSGNGFAVREVGSTFDNPPDFSSRGAPNMRVIGLNASGQFQAWTQAITDTFYVRGWIAPASGGSPTSTITMTLKDLAGAVTRNNLTNLQFAWFPISFPTSLSTPTTVGTAETTDGSGELVITVDSAAATTGWLVLYSPANNWQGSYKVTTA